MRIKILKGDIKEVCECWDIEEGKFVAGWINPKEIPISELLSITKTEQIKRLCYVDFKFTNDINFTASMKENVYANIYEQFISKGNQPTGIELPIIRKSKAKGILIVVGVLILLSMFSGGGDESNKDTVKISKQSNGFSLSEESKLCKAYISALFGRPTSIMNNYMNENGITYIRYTRKDDNQTFSYGCEISKNSMVWVAYLNDADKWGRWRYEDKVALNRSDDGSIVKFTRKDTGMTTTVNFKDW